MRYLIPMLADRVAPRCTGAESLMLVSLRSKQVAAVETIPIEDDALAALLRAIADRDVDALVCGGIGRNTRASVQARGVAIIENVACRTAELIDALTRGTLCSGYGFAPTPPAGAPAADGGEIDCLSCHDRACLRGAPCAAAQGLDDSRSTGEHRRIIEAALDVSLENERILCRLSELVYFCLEMGYRRIGLAFCLELLEPVDLLADLLRRFFAVFPVCCKVGGRLEGSGSSGAIACNPLGQAEVLNRIGTDFNVLVGLCLGMDSVFQRASTAPTTTLIVKDKSLAHNPIGALYSEYYQQEVARTSVDTSWK